MTTIDMRFKTEQIVWAKVRGYPWWPAVVSLIHHLLHPKLIQLSDIRYSRNE